MEDTETTLSELGKFTKDTPYHSWNIMGEYRLQLSEGVRYLRNAAECDPLLMQIAQSYHDNDIDLGHYTFTVMDGAGELSVYDRSGTLLGALQIDETEFPLSKIELYCENDTFGGDPFLRLPSER